MYRHPLAPLCGSATAERGLREVMLGGGADTVVESSLVSIPPVRNEPIDA